MRDSQIRFLMDMLSCYYAQEEIHARNCPAFASLRIAGGSWSEFGVPTFPLNSGSVEHPVRHSTQTAQSVSCFGTMIAVKREVLRTREVPIAWYHLNPSFDRTVEETRKGTPGVFPLKRRTTFMLMHHLLTEFLAVEKYYTSYVPASTWNFCPGTREALRCLVERGLVSLYNADSGSMLEPRKGQSDSVVPVVVSDAALTKLWPRYFFGKSRYQYYNDWLADVSRYIRNGGRWASYFQYQEVLMQEYLEVKKEYPNDYAQGGVSWGVVPESSGTVTTHQEAADETADATPSTAVVTPGEDSNTPLVETSDTETPSAEETSV